MAKVSTFHTTNLEQPQVYHDQSECHDGKAIKPANKALGTGDKPKCKECIRIA